VCAMTHFGVEIGCDRRSTGRETDDLQMVSVGRMVTLILPLKVLQKKIEGEKTQREVLEEKFSNLAIGFCRTEGVGNWRQQVELVVVYRLALGDECVHTLIEYLQKLVVAAEEEAIFVSFGDESSLIKNEEHVHATIP
jgi:hypothetical protein